MSVTVSSGRQTLKIPLIETVSTLSLSTMPIEMDVTGALTRGTIPVNVKAMPTSRIAGSLEQRLGNPIDALSWSKECDGHRHDGPRDPEGTLRGILATHGARGSECNRIALAQQVAKEAREDMQRLAWCWTP